MSTQNNESKIGEFSPLTESARRLFDLAKYLSPATWLSKWVPVLKPRSELSLTEVSDPEFTKKRGRAIDRYVLGCLAAELTLVAVVVVATLSPTTRILIAIVVSLRVIEILQVTVNIAIFDNLGRRPDNTIGSSGRMAFLSFINFLELIACFGVIYASDWIRLHGAGQPMTGLYLSVITQLTIGYGDVYPIGYLRVVAAIQGIVGLVFVVLVFARVVSTLPPIKSLDDVSPNLPGSDSAAGCGEQLGDLPLMKTPPVCETNQSKVWVFLRWATPLASGFILMAFGNFAAVLLFAACLAISESIFVLWPIIAALVTIASLWKLDVYIPSRDNWMLLASLVLGWTIWRKAIEVPGWRRRVGFTMTVPIIFWLLMSVVEPLVQRQPLTRDPGRFKNASTKDGDVRIGLALSGGGYRAALMHAGVLTALETCDVRPHRLSVISGGSIIGAFYAAGGAPTDFRDAVIDGRLHIKRAALRFQNIIRFGQRADIQSELLDAVLFGRLSLTNSSKDGQLPIVIGATDLIHGRAVGFGPSFAIIRRPLSLAEKHEYVNEVRLPHYVTTEYRPYTTTFGEEMLVSRLVTASGAFPLAFNAIPMTLHYSDFGRDTKDKMLLADGGISDNTGIDLLLDAHRESGGSIPYVKRRFKNGELTWPQLDGWHQDIVIASDASAAFAQHNVSGTLSDFGRAVDIVYKNVRAREIYPRARMPQVFALSPETPLRLRDEAIADARNGDIRGAVFRRFAFTKLLEIGDSRLVELLMKLIQEDLTLRNVKEAEALEILNKRVKEDSEDGRNAKAELNKFLVEDYEVCLREFEATSTLTERFDAAEANRLFRLGVYLVVGQWVTLNSTLQTLAMEKQEALKLWLRIRDAALQVAAEKFDEPPFDAELDVTKLFSIDAHNIANGFVPNFDETVAALAQQKARNPIELAMRARVVLMAHRFAHAIYHSRHPKADYYPKRTLSDEFFGKVTLEPDEEKECDVLTAQIVETVKGEPKSCEWIFDYFLGHFGRSVSNPNLSIRLEKMRRQKLEEVHSK